MLRMGIAGSMVEAVVEAGIVAQATGTSPAVAEVAEAAFLGELRLENEKLTRAIDECKLDFDVL